VAINWRIIAGIVAREWPENGARRNNYAENICFTTYFAFFVCIYEKKSVILQAKTKNTLNF
jgi:hypothetical protein